MIIRNNRPLMVIPFRHLICLVFFIFSIRNAGAVQVPLQRYTVDDGLPQSSIFSALQDHRGYFWFGTQNGLCRFNGIEFTVFTRAKDGVSEDRILGLVEDRDGNIWAGSQTNGIFRFDGEKWQQFTTRDGLPSNAFREFYPFSKGGVTANMVNGIVEWNGKSFTPFPYPFDPTGFKMQSIAMDAANNVWMATADKGILKYDGKSIIPVVGKELFSSPTIRILPDSKGRLWIANIGEGLRMWDGSAMHSFRNIIDSPLNERILTLFEDRDGNIWVGTLAGVSEYSERGWVHLTERDGLPNNAVQVIRQDREGNIWLGTVGGLAKLTSLKFRSFTAREGLPDNSVWAIHQDMDGDILLGVNRGGLMQFDGLGWKKMETLPAIDAIAIRSLFLDRKGRLWLGHGRGLAVREEGRWRDVGKEIGYSPLTIFAILEDREGHIWFGSQIGIFVYDGSNWKQITRKDGLPGDITCCLYLDREGRVWVGTTSGAAAWDGKAWKSFTTADGLSHNYIMGITQDVHGAFWFATFGGGLCRLDGKNWDIFTAQKGLSNDYCYFIIADKEFVYVGTNKGLNRFDGKQFKVYSSRDGLPASETNQGAVFRDREGYLWIGTVGGVSQFDPDLDRPNPIPPPVVIAGVNLFDRPVPLIQPLRFKHNQNFLRFDFFGISYTSPEDVRYRYKLEGVDENWIETTQRSISYAKLPPGDYTFTVNACNEELVWNPQSAILAFSILPPFWATWWFQSGLLMTLILSLVGYRWYETRAIRQRNVMLQAMVKERTHELEEKTSLLEESNKRLEELDKLKTNFLSTVSHELRTPLTSIRAFSEILLDNPDEVLEARTRFIKIINDESERLTRLIEDLLDLSRIQSGKQKWVMRPLRFADVVENSIEALNGLAQGKELVIEANLPSDLPVVIGDFDKLGQVLTNLLSNAVKFSPAGRCIFISADTLNTGAQPYLHCAVTDKGEGIAEGQLEAIFQKFYQVDSTATRTKGGTGLGLAICREIMQYHHGKIWAESVVGQGSTFHILLPLQAVPAAGQEIASIFSSGHPPSRVLIVDDEPNIREFIRYELQRIGYQVLEAATGEEALAIAVKEHPEVIILDILLPGIDGFEVISRLKAEPQTRDIEVVVVSIVDDKERGFQLGAYDYYCKPLDKDRLLHTVEQLMDRLPKHQEAGILIVDDDPAILEVLETILAVEGYKTRKASDGNMALQLIRESLPDLIIIDIKMPGLDGYEVIKTLKAAERTRNIPVIVLTASDLGHSRTKSLLLGATDYFQKPFSREEFMTGLKRALGAAAEGSKEKKGSLESA